MKKAMTISIMLTMCVLSISAQSIYDFKENPVLNNIMARPLQINDGLHDAL